ncbi:MAG: ABC transporter ATP-binding protein [Candidatus Marinamargulisbacteria bacterium]
MINIRGLNKTYSNNQVLFRNLDLTINDGENVAIIGPSGCGKSTILRYILGLKFPDSGDVFIDGKNINGLDERELLQLRLNLGMLFQSSALFDSFTVEENIAFPLIENYGYVLKDARKKVDYVLDLVGLSGFNLKMPYQLSGGQQKRVGLARAIITEPKYLFFDEPTAGLDPITTTNIENVIIRLNETLKSTTVVVSHEKSTILRTAKKIYLIDNKTLLDFETPDTIKTSSQQAIKDFMREA